jgi:hypothetical protein
MVKGVKGESMHQERLRAARATRVGAVLLALLAWATSGGRARADDVRAMMSDAAENIATFLKAHKRSTIALGFSGPPTFKNATSQAFIQLLSEQLAARKVRVSDRAKFGVKGEFKPVLRDTGGRGSEKAVALAVSIKIVDDFGKVFLDYDLGGTLVGEDDVLSALGVSSDLAGAKDKKGRARRIRDSIRNPKVVLAGNKARASAGSPYAVEVLVKRRPRRLLDRDGLAYFEVDLKEEYTLRLSNASDREVAVQVRVDGLSVFHFSELRSTDLGRRGEPKYRYYIVPARSRREVPGWHKTNKRALGFRVAPLEESAAFKLGKAEDVGMITASFFACWKKDERPPADEPPAESRGGARVTYTERRVRDAGGKSIPVKQRVYVMPMSARVGTSFGSERLTDGRGVQRTIGALRAVVPLRYKRPKEARSSD